MEQNSQNKSLVNTNAIPSQSVIYVQAPVVDEGENINVIDLWAFVITHFKWTLLTIALSFLFVFCVANIANNHITYQQSISLPTVTNTQNMSKEVLISGADIMDAFASNYLIYWNSSPGIFINHTFSLSQDLDDKLAKAQKMPQDMLSLSIVASKTQKQQVQRLFKRAEDAIQSIVQGKVQSWQKNMAIKIKNEQRIIKTLQKAVLEKPDGVNAKVLNNNMIGHSLMLAQLQNHLVKIQSQLLSSQWRLSSLNAMTALQGTLVMSTPASKWIVLIKSLFISIVVGIGVMILIGFCLMHMRPAQNNT